MQYLSPLNPATQQPSYTAPFTDCIRTRAEKYYKVLKKQKSTSSGAAVCPDEVHNSVVGSLDHFHELLLGDDRDSKIMCFCQLAAGSFPCQQVVRFL